VVRATRVFGVVLQNQQTPFVVLDLYGLLLEMRVFKTVLHFVLVRIYLHFLRNFDHFIDVLVTLPVFAHHGSTVCAVKICSDIQGIAMSQVGVNHLPLHFCGFW
jgi:hypothetical protein